MANEKPGFYIWFSAVDAMAELDFAEKGMIYSAVEEYARDGVLPTFEDRLLRSIWTRLKSDLDADDAKYRKNQRDNQIKGWKSDFKRNYAPAHGIDPNDEAALDAYIQQRLTAVDGGEQMSTNNNTNPNINTNSSINTTPNIKGNDDYKETRRDKGCTPREYIKPTSSESDSLPPSLNESEQRIYIAALQQGYTPEGAARLITEARNKRKVQGE